jgi:sec-independent protein translocase protein TatA
MAFGLGVPELLILLVIFLIIFGVGRLPQVGSALGRSIREFRENIRDNESVQPK